MPAPSSPFDDPFADLFGKLPDPRGRAGVARAPEGTAPGGATAAHVEDEGEDTATAGESAPEATSPSPSSAPETEPAPPGRPLSRREARRAAAAAARSQASAPPDETPHPRPASASVASESSPSATESSPSAAVGSVSSRVASESAPAASESAPAGSEPAASGPAPRDGEAARPAAPVPAARPAATATLDALFTGEVSTDQVGAPPPPPDRRRRRVGAWVALAVVLALVGGIGVGVAWVWNTYEQPIRAFMGWEEPKDYEEGEATGEALVTILSGDTGGPISQALFDAGVTKTPDAFYDYLIDTRQNPPFQPGVYLLQQKMTSAAALDALLDPAKKQSNTAQLREGLTVEQSLPLLAEGLALPVEEFEAAVANPADYGVAADTLEGWLFPATYTFDPGVTATDVVRTLVDRTVQSLDAAGVPGERREEILTIASIIQREARFEDDFYKVSRVIQNRLAPDNNETNGLLQMDSTAQYGYQEMHDGTVSSSREALEDDNPWNTYRHPGLPVGPIANPGDLAIDAAMHPAEGPWMYFVTVNLDTGETIFTNTGAEHEQAVKQWQQWCADNPDSGC
ncbi:endolytic transglycosylase MltG [Microbacterium sp. zg.Y1090]|uniref:endolytic transglycosylase MltG n=1 Tax=Microbacterium wangruii TaxID=3049073 RepID=UPI00214DC561|nr:MULTISPECIES: endolytic transglycosylase MltG [unclassified Microbacterium]MCR2818673.1 endolytic transglycosylase MltG [Microbacterium sp. zg.Y1090]MDL5486486.1 endolytic transglycosylase MltG [Microbacterium sp. zg-Y1211]WIM26996.1 endolytic transglycosylase MltG [Microbacterium sp. zg-Y1090]